MSIIEQTTKLLLTQFKGSSINPALLAYYTSDMKKIDDAYTSVDGRLSALETSSSDYADRLTSLETWKNDTVNPTLTEYDNRLDTIEAVIETVSTANIDALTERVDALEHKVEANSEHIITLNGNVEALSDAVTAIQRVDNEQNNRLTTVERKVSALEECCEEVRGTLSDHNTRITNNATAISGLDTRLTEDEALIRANAEDITILANQVETNANNINRILDDIPIDDIINAVSRIDALETLCGDESLTTTAQNLTGAINELDEDITEINSDLSSVSERVTTVEGKVEALEEKVGSATLTTTAQDLCGAVNELDAELATLGGLPSDVANLSNRVATAESNVAGLSTRMDSTDITISSIQSDIDTLDGKVSQAETDIAGIKALDGDGQLDTTAQNFTDAINELNQNLGIVSGNITAKGLLFTFQKQNSWCRCVISGTLTEAISDGVSWASVVPSDFRPSAIAHSAGIAPMDINNSALSIQFSIDGGIVANSGVGTLSIGSLISQQMYYPC